MKQTFEQWMEQFERLCNKKLGFSTSDLPDFCFKDCYNAGDSPSEALREFVQYVKEAF